MPESIRDGFQQSAGTYPVGAEKIHPPEPRSVDPREMGVKEEFVVGRGEQPLAAGQPAVETTPAPQDPTTSQELAELKASVGELKQLLGQRQTEFDKRLAEQNLIARYNQASGRVAAPQAPRVDNPDDPVTKQELMTALTQIDPLVRSEAAAQAIRATWDVTPEEETEVLQANPQARSYPEPNRSRFILEMVKLKRQPAPEIETAPAPEAISPQDTRPQRPAVPTVPQPEVARTPVVEETPSFSAVELAQRQYLEAEALPSEGVSDKARNERLRRMRIAKDQLDAAQGFTDDMQQEMGFKQKI